MGGVMNPTELHALLRQRQSAAAHPRRRAVAAAAPPASMARDIDGLLRQQAGTVGASAGGVFWRLFSDLRWARGFDCEVGDNRGRW